MLQKNRRQKYYASCILLLIPQRYPLLVQRLLLLVDPQALYVQTTAYMYLNQTAY